MIKVQRRPHAVIISFLSICVILGSASAHSGVSKTIPEIGLHTPLLKFEKNENPQNLMIVFTKLDAATCAFDAKAETPMLDEYWLMDGAKYKRVHPLIKSSVQDRLEVDRAAFQTSKQFLVHLKDFKELNSDLGPSPMFEVKAKKTGGGCEALVEMKLGPSDKNRRIQIESIYAESSKKLLPPFRKLKALTIIGKDVATGEAVRRTYSAN